MPLIYFDPSGEARGIIHDPVPGGYAEMLAGQGSFSQAVPADFLTLPLDAHFWDGSGVAIRPAMPVEIEEDGAMVNIVGLPPGATVSVDGNEVAPEGDRLELMLADPGAFAIKVECWPYLPWSATVEVSP